MPGRRRLRAAGVLGLAGLAILAVVGAWVALRPGDVDPERYSVREVRLEGMYWVAGEAINDRGQVAGCCGAEHGEVRAFLWDLEAGVTDLHAEGWRESQALDINDGGQVVGLFKEGGDEWFLFHWDPAEGVAVIVGPQTAGISGAGHDVQVNASGQAGGTAVFAQEDGTELRQAFVWDRAGGVQPLVTGVLAGRESLLWAINDAGQVVGRYIDEGGGECVFLWDAEAGARKLDLSGRSFPHMNSRGQLAGYANELTVEVWHPDEGATRLTEVMSAQFPDMEVQSSIVQGLSDAGQVVGWTYFRRTDLMRFLPQKGVRYNFVYQPPGEVIVLERQPALAGHWIEASDINNAGVVLVKFCDEGMYTHMGLLTPIEGAEIGGSP